jgi:DNA-binding MarR family transcriptional regulator
VAQRFAARVVLFHAAVADRLGLNTADLKVLRLLGDEPTTAGRLAEETRLTGAAITALLDRLEASGYVTRERDSGDRRRVTVRAVPSRLRKIDRVYDGLYEAMGRLLGKYSAPEFAAIEDYLTRTSQVLAEQAAVLHGDSKPR